MGEDISWGERDPQDAEALRCLVDAEAYFRQAMLKGSIKLYSRALEYSEKVIQYFPWSVIAHYISAVAHLKGLGDKNYAKQKYKLLQTFKSEEANNLAKKLKIEIEGTNGNPGKSKM
jgi:hypothetical protein